MQTDISKANGVIVYEGPSLIDGKPIVVIATGLKRSSKNSKTGNMVQTWIIRSDVDPFTALATGADASICGGCKHRPKVRNPEARKYGQRTCYVDVRPVNTIWKAYHRGVYARPASSQLPDVFAGKVVRLGSYGDPAAVPLAIWQLVTAKSVSHTGYTHQWRSERLRSVTALCQASVDSPEEAAKAQSLGLGYFRVKAPSEAKLDGEIVCPASAEAGKVTTCSDCRMCSGKGLTVVIDVHGIGASNFTPKPSRQLAVVS